MCTLLLLSVVCYAFFNALVSHTKIASLLQHTMYFLQGVHIRKPMERLRRSDNIDRLIVEGKLIGRALNNLNRKNEM